MMPGPVTIFTIGGLAGVAVYVNRRKSQTSESDSMSPIALARRRSSTVTADPEWQSRKQPEILWLRDNGVSFSHNSKPKYPTGQRSNSTSSILEQTSSTK